MRRPYGDVGELAETTPLLRVRTLTGTEGSNPSVSAIFNIFPSIANYSISEIIRLFFFDRISYFSPFFPFISFNKRRISAARFGSL